MSRWLEWFATKTTGGLSVSKRARPVGAGREDQGEIQIHELGYILGQPLGLSFVAPPLDEDGLTFHVAQRVQSLQERGDQGRPALA